MTEQNKALVRQFLEEVWNKGNLKFVDEYFSEEFRPHFLPPNLPANREGFKAHVSMWRTAFPDLKNTTMDVIGDGDKVVVRWKIRGTHQANFMGLAATGREINAEGVTTFRLRDGKVVEGWSLGDMLGLLIQLGVVHSPWPN